VAATVVDEGTAADDAAAPPAGLQQLQRQVAQLQQQLGQGGGAPQSWGGFVATVSLSVGLGVLLGALGLYVLQSRLVKGRGGSGGAKHAGSNGVHYSPARGLRAGDDEDGDAVPVSDTRRLLELSKGANGHGLQR
jgi:hypothetical protein